MTRLAIAVLIPAFAASALLSPQAVHAATCADWKPNALNELLCNLNLIGPPAATPTPTPTPSPTPTPTPAPTHPGALRSSGR